ncbi:MAG: error-prone DNA polymerase, partial [Rhodospirillaceae bacterium]
SHELLGFPRHLSQHVGGFVITDGPLHEMVPIENAAMEDRTVIEWDKDDLDALGMLKIDVLALGMLTCLRKGFDLLRAHKNIDLGIATLPQEDPAVYDMLCKADSIGVFQVESRAQMTMLPRLKPRTFYDLVIEVAIVRPGPIQGNMVHPYLRRRNGTEPITFPSKELEDVLGKTYGVPLFQEQAMRIAIVAAGFSGAEADGLRRAMATFRRHGTIHMFERKFIDGMTSRGYDQDFAERCFEQIKGFGDYGFPESHAASFALLVYASAWMKCFHPDVFACAMLNSQPMGFYAPAQLVRDAREHGVEIRPVDINYSYWDSTLEPNVGGFALRLGFHQIKGCAETDAKTLTANRGEGYASIADLWRRSALKPTALEVLAKGDAFGSLGLSRRDALWHVRGLDLSPLPLFSGASNASREPAANLPAMKLGEHIVEDYAHLGLSVKSHPLALLRERLAAERIVTNDHLVQMTDGAKAKVAGLVLVRQRPGTASGVIFATLEDETGVANIVIWPKTFERFRRVVLGSRLMGVIGKVQKEGLVLHVVADRLLDLSHHLESLMNLDAPALQAGLPHQSAIKPASIPYKAMPAGRNFR